MGLNPSWTQLVQDLVSAICENQRILSASERIILWKTDLLGELVYAGSLFSFK
jgi:hypothetical protein